MPGDQRINYRRSLRLPGYDYSSPGAYFVTLVHPQSRLLFEHDQLCRIARNVWNAIPTMFPNVELNAFVVMPNHVHGIVMIGEREALAGVSNQTSAVMDERLTPAATEVVQGGGVARSGLPDIVRYYKNTTARRINSLRRTRGTAVWQRSYWDRILRNDRAVEVARNYIMLNPLRWDSDPENPVARPSGLSEEQQWDRWFSEQLVLPQ
ncbi:MAG: transposase [Dehalococcoidia bacterium]